MKKLFIFILSFPLLTSFGQSTNSFCSFNQNGEKYELNLVDGTGSVTWVKYNRSGDILNSGRGTWSMSNDAVYGGLYERLTVNIPTGQMKFLVVRTSRGAIQELQDESAYKRNFQPCTSIFSGGNNQAEKIIQYNSNASRIIGTSIRIGNLEVAQYDFPQQLTWDDAKKTCDLLGDDWRLPTKYELNDLFQNKIKIGNFKRSDYWSSTEKDFEQSWSQDFNDGSESYFYKSSKKVGGIVISPKAFYVRAVKNFKPPTAEEIKKAQIEEKKRLEQAKIDEKNRLEQAIINEKNRLEQAIQARIKTIGTPIKIFNFEVAENDFPGGEKMTWEEAKKACESLGDGWRLPTKDELFILYLNKKNINVIRDYTYWSSTKIGNLVDIVSFIDGRSSSSGSSYGWVVRAIRTIKRGDSAKESIFSTSDKQIVIGTTIKIRNLEVAQFDFAQKMNWDLAKVACDALGDGWRLPTKDELKILYRNKSNVWGSERVFKAIWSSTEYGASLDGAWYQYMSNDSPSYKGKTQTGDVRAVRSFK
jgi:hypothetical protein